MPRVVSTDAGSLVSDMNSYRIVKKRNEPLEQEQEPVAAVAAVETRIVSVTKPKKRVRSLAGRARKLERDIGLGHAGGTMVRVDRRANRAAKIRSSWSRKISSWF